MGRAKDKNELDRARKKWDHFEESVKEGYVPAESKRNSELSAKVRQNEFLNEWSQKETYQHGGTINKKIEPAPKKIKPQKKYKF